FFIFAFFGWIIDTADRSRMARRFSPGGFFRAPICPIYGIGGLMLVFIFKYFSSLPFYSLIIFATLSVIFLEYFGGIFSEKVLMVRLWDYSKSKFNISGYIDAAHSFYWLVLVSVFYFYIFPSVLKFENILIVPKYFDLPALTVFFLIFAWFTIRKSPTRFLEFKDKVLDLSVSEYQHLVSDIKKYQKIKSDDARRALDERIRKRLKDTGARMKKRD
ncbi:MAG: putative ABC transporter permease, partial [bacterium]